MENEQQQQRMIAEGEAKTQFLANMSHEIRTPINAVLGMNEMILRKTTDQEVIDYATNIESSGNFLLSVVNDILDYTKIQSGNLQLIDDDYALSSLLNDLRMTFSSRAEKKDLKFAIRVEETTPEHLIGDEFRIRQIAMNIINNAIKYTDDGSVTVFVSGKEESDGEVVLSISVADTGRGIKKEDRDKLFIDFSRVDEEHNRNIEGTGLGLSITKSLLDMMGGSMELESKYGRGSTFTVHIPQKCENYMPVGDFSKRISNIPTAREAYTESFHAIRARVLVVDDNEMNLEVVRLLLEPTKIKIKTCDSGRKALRLMEEEEFHLIFLDQMMPEMNGVQTLHEMRNRFPDMTAPVVALTANALSGAREKFLKEGFSDYLSKPVKAEDLEQCLQKWLPKELMEEVVHFSEDEIRQTNYNPGEDEFKIGNREPVKTLKTNRWLQAAEEKQESVTVSGIEFPAIEGMDWSVAVEYLQTEELIKLTIQKMVEISPKLSGQLRELKEKVLSDPLNDRVLEDYETQAHSMKANLRTIGSGLMDAAFRLETAGKDRQIDIIRTETEPFLRDWQDLIDQLETYVKTN